MLRIEWSARKNRGNILKHGVDFEEAKSVFDDPMQLTESDPDHSMMKALYYHRNVIS